MSTIVRIDKDVVESLKDKNELKTSVLRMLKSAVKNDEINKKRELTEEEVVSVIEKQAKQRREAIEKYREAGRDDLREKEAEELSILAEYLPEKLSEDEVEKIVNETIDSLGMESDFGRVMGTVMGKLKGKADGDLVRGLVSKRLGK